MSPHPVELEAFPSAHVPIDGEPLEHAPPPPRSRPLWYPACARCSEAWRAIHHGPALVPVESLLVVRVNPAPDILFTLIAKCHGATAVHRVVVLNEDTEAPLGQLVLFRRKGEPK